MRQLHLGADILVLDLAGGRREHLPTLQDVPYLTLTPDWVCEIVSPTTARVDWMRKMPIYARERVSHLWIVNPNPRTLEVYRLEGPHWVVVSPYGRAENIRAVPFAALELDVSRWWLEE